MSNIASGIFNIGGTEIIVILIIAFLIVGPQDLPKVAKWLARAFKKIRAALGDFQASLSEEIDKTGIGADIKEAVGDMKEMSTDLKSSMDGINPLADIEKDLANLNPLSEVNAIEKDLKSSFSDLNPLSGVNNIEKDLKSSFSDLNPLSELKKIE